MEHGWGFCLCYGLAGCLDGEGKGRGGTVEIEIEIEDGGFRGGLGRGGLWCRGVQSGTLIGLEHGCLDEKFVVSLAIRFGG